MDCPSCYHPYRLGASRAGVPFGLCSRCGHIWALSQPGRPAKQVYVDYQSLAAQEAALELADAADKAPAQAAAKQPGGLMRSLRTQKLNARIFKAPDVNARDQAG
jgi:hypothetical protein